MPGLSVGRSRCCFTQQHTAYTGTCRPVPAPDELRGVIPHIQHIHNRSRSPSSSSPSLCLSLSLTLTFSQRFPLSLFNVHLLPPSSPSPPPTFTSELFLLILFSLSLPTLPSFLSTFPDSSFRFHAHTIFSPFLVPSLWFSVVSFQFG